MPKKNAVLKGLGARYGIKPRKQFTQIHHLMKQKRKCPECGGSIIREAVGIWVCKKCGIKIAGTAYDIKL
jgi:large subunit ribosomal protein L37Ae